MGGKFSSVIKQAVSNTPVECGLLTRQQWLEVFADQIVHQCAVACAGVAMDKQRVDALVSECTTTVEIVNIDTNLTHVREFVDYEQLVTAVVKQCAEAVSALSL